jgi:hypothetical protein
MYYIYMNVYILERFKYETIYLINRQGLVLPCEAAAIIAKYICMFAYNLPKSRVVANLYFSLMHGIHHNYFDYL